MLHRSVAGGGFAHGERDVAGPYLGDTLAMGQAFVALYTVTGNRGNLDAAAAAARFIGGHFAPLSAGGGFVTSRIATDSGTRPRPDRDENIALVRFLSVLAVATGHRGFMETLKRRCVFLLLPRSLRSRFQRVCCSPIRISPKLLFM